MTWKTSGITARTVKPSSPALASTASGKNSAFLMAPAGPAPDEVNRKNFEDNAGPNAGRLLLRSAPSGASIFINDLFVGQTPLFMIIEPGKYKIHMRGTRQETGNRRIGIMPKETEKVLINLNQRYPDKVALR